MITIRQKGDFSKVTDYLNKLSSSNRFKFLDKYGRAGVSALSSTTPVKTGLTANSWTYEIENKDGNIAINFLNTNINDGVPIAIILQHGHGTGTGGWVQGRDYINPALQPIFDQMAEEAWKEVCNQ